MNALTHKYAEGTRVKIFNLGDGFTHTGTVRGISQDYFPVMIIYIVELDANNPWSWQYSCATFPTSCLQEI